MLNEGEDEIRQRQAGRPGQLWDEDEDESAGDAGVRVAQMRIWDLELTGLYGISRLW